MDAFSVFCSALKLEMEVVKQHNLRSTKHLVTGQQTNRTANSGDPPKPRVLRGAGSWQSSYYGPSSDGQSTKNTLTNN